MNVQIPAPNPRQPAPLMGVEKVAILLLALGKPRATELLKQFEPGDIHLIRTAADRLKPIAASDLTALVEEFASGLSRSVDFVGSVAEIEDLLSDVLKDGPIERELFEIPEEPVWDLLEEVDEIVLGAYLAKEHPQTVALMLSRVNSTLSAKLVSTFEAQRRNDILQRILDIEDCSDAPINAVEGVLRSELIDVEEATDDPFSRAANILNKLEKEQQGEILSAIELINMEKAATLRSMLFTFDDLVRLDQKDLVVVFDSVPVDDVVTSLRGAEEAVQALVLSALAARARRVVEAELRSGQIVADDKISAARQVVANKVLELAGEGRIQIGDEDASGIDRS